MSCHNATAQYYLPSQSLEDKFDDKSLHLDTKERKTHKSTIGIQGLSEYFLARRSKSSSASSSLLTMRILFPRAVA